MDLNEGEEYNFRIRARNAVGLGDSLQTLHPVIAKDDIAKPDVDLKDLYKGSITAKAGSNISLKLPLLGERLLFIYATLSHLML